MSTANLKDGLANEMLYEALLNRPCSPMTERLKTKYTSKYSVFTWPRFICLSGCLVVVPHAGAEPTGGQVVNGQAQITQTDASGSNTTTIKQNTPQVSIHWQSFNVGDKDRVVFQ